MDKPTESATPEPAPSDGDGLSRVSERERREILELLDTALDALTEPGLPLGWQDVEPVN